jgi:hypothetical protein
VGGNWVSIQSWLGRRTDKTSNRAAARVWAADENPVARGSVTTLIYLLCIAYWVAVVAICAALFSVWWWTPQLFPRLVLTAFGVMIAYTSTPSRRRSDLEVLWTQDAQWRAFVDESAEHFGVGRPQQIGFTPEWIATSQEVGHSGSLIFGVALWQALSPRGRVALLAQLMSPARSSRNIQHGFVRITVASLREWATFCNYRSSGDLLSFSSTGQSRYASTTGQGLAIVGGWLMDGLLAIIGFVPAVMYSALSVALVRQTLWTERASDEFAIEVAGREAVVHMLKTMMGAEYFKMAMQRAVLGRAASPLAAVREAAEEFDRDGHALDRRPSGDGVRLAFVSRQPSGGSFSYLAGRADLDMPADISDRLDREISNGLKYQYSVTPRSRFGTN